uniref:Uncharacterized protein n=1 Tax=Ditylum brightwellii TaxID=49249 RepID=A0A7S4RLA2_9STRA
MADKDKALKEEGQEPEEERWIESEGINTYYLNGKCRKGPLIGATKEDGDNDGYNCFDMSTLFADPDPMDNFVATYHIKSTQEINQAENTIKFYLDKIKGNIDNEDSNETESEKDIQEKEITITLRGIKAENGQLLHSTGLTLWNASHLLCRFLSLNPFLIRGKSVIEVCMLIRFKG